MTEHKQSVRDFISKNVHWCVLGTQVLYYDFDLQQWNHAFYWGHYNLHRDENTLAVQRMKRDIEALPEFKDFEVAAILTAVERVQNVVANDKYDVNPRWSMQQYHNRDQVEVLGNIVARNRRTGEFAKFINAWLRCRTDVVTDKYNGWLYGATAYSMAPQIYARQFKKSGGGFGGLVQTIARQNRQK